MSPSMEKSDETGDVCQIQDNHDSNPEAKLSSRKRYIYTGFIFVFYITNGIAYSIWGPTWVHLIELMGSSQDKMSYGNSLFAVGNIVGAFSSGFVFDYLNRQLIISLNLLLMAFSICLTPMLKKYEIFLGLAFIFGMGEGGLDTGCNSWILEMWLDDNGPVMQSLYFFFAVGTFLSPLICMNFLSDINLNAERHLLTYEANGKQNLFNTNTQKNFSLPVYAESTVPITGTTIEIPYMITSTLLIAASILNIMSYIFYRYHPDDESTILKLKVQQNRSKKDSILDSISTRKASGTPRPTVSTSQCPSIENSQSAGHFQETFCQCSSSKSDQKVAPPEQHLPVDSRRQIIIFVMIGAVMCCFYDGMENTTFEYTPSLLVNSPLQISEAKAAKLVSAMSGVFMVVRGLGILLVLRVSNKLLIMMDLIFVFIGTTLVYFNLESSESGVRNGLMLIGLGLATFMPCMFSYLEEHLRMTNRICALLTLSCVLISTVEPIVVGYLIDTQPSILPCLNFASLTIVAIAFSCLELFRIYHCLK